MLTRTISLLSESFAVVARTVPVTARSSVAISPAEAELHRRTIERSREPARMAAVTGSEP
jgi:hypothetical protein